jgi:hypothetical protein
MAQSSGQVEAKIPAKCSKTLELSQTGAGKFRDAAKTIVGNSPNKWLDAQVTMGLNWESGSSMPWQRTTKLSPARVVVTRDFGLRKDVC